MEENKRYNYKKNYGYWFIIDTVSDEKYFINKFLVGLLNQQDKKIKELKEQLSDEELSHDMCIISFENEIGNLCKQIKFESNARERFSEKVKQLKQSQKQLAINELVKLRQQFFDLFLYPTFDVISSIIDKQIEELKGDIIWKTL